MPRSRHSRKTQKRSSRRRVASRKSSRKSSHKSSRKSSRRLSRRKTPSRKSSRKSSRRSSSRRRQKGAGGYSPREYLQRRAERKELDKQLNALISLVYCIDRQARDYFVRIEDYDRPRVIKAINAIPDDIIRKAIKQNNNFCISEEGSFNKWNYRMPYPRNDVIVNDMCINPKFKNTDGSLSNEIKSKLKKLKVVDWWKYEEYFKRICNVVSKGEADQEGSPSQDSVVDQQDPSKQTVPESKVVSGGKRKSRKNRR